MENYHSALVPGEYAVLRSRSYLEWLQMDCSPELLNAVVPSDMAAHADNRVLITNRSYYHFGQVLYTLDGLHGYWPERALMDHLINHDDHLGNKPANLFYKAVKSSENGFVEIRSHDGRLFCSFRKHDPDSAVDDINRVASLRTRTSFADRYGFDGFEYEGRDSCKTDITKEP